MNHPDGDDNANGAPTMTAAAWANSDALVDTNWVAAHLDDANVRIVESSADASRYGAGHIPGAVALDWRADQQSQLIRDFITRLEFETLAASHGIAIDTTVVFYGDSNNWYAAYCFWLFRMYGHLDCRLMDGGRARWEAEGRHLSRETPTYVPTTYQARGADLSIRAFRDQVLAHTYAGKPLIDARSSEEFSGQGDLNENSRPAEAQRAGHIPTARNISWDAAVNEEGTFKDPGELRQLYLAHEIRPDQPVIVYCHTGERSAHTWFVLTQLLGYPDVRVYDGSWTEWGSLVRAPIEWEAVIAERD